MGILSFIERLLPSRRSIDSIAPQLHREMESVTDGGMAHQILEGIAATPPTMQQCRDIVDVLARLPQRQRAVMELRIKGMELDEIAQEIGVTFEVARREWISAMCVLNRELPRDG